MSVLEDLNAVQMIFAMLLGAVALVWGIMMFLLPFFVWGAWQRARECSERLDTLINAARAESARGTERFETLIGLSRAEAERRAQRAARSP